MPVTTKSQRSKQLRITCSSRLSRSPTKTKHALTLLPRSWLQTLLSSAGLVTLWPLVNTIFAPIQFFSKSSNPGRHLLFLPHKPQRMTISCHWLAPSRPGMTTYLKLGLSPSWATLLTLHTLCWEPQGADQPGLPIAGSEEDRQSGQAWLDFSLPTLLRACS